MKRFLAILLAAMMIFALASCGAKKDDAKQEEGTAAQNGKLVVGITDFAPMDYKDDNGNWIGFDADLAKAFAESLGMDVEFVEIEWDNKILELNSENIDCVWNGMTLTDEVKEAMGTTKPYLNNTQVVVVKKDLADQYKTVEDLKELKFAVENGSSGMDAAEECGLTFTPVMTQADALMEVKAGTSDAAVIDSIMAYAMVGEGTSYADLAVSVKLADEEYGVGFRKGSDLVAKLDDFIASNQDLVKELAQKYGIEGALIG